MSSTLNALGTQLQKDQQTKQQSFQLNMLNDLNSRLGEELRKCQSRLGLEHFVPYCSINNSKLLSSFPAELQYLAPLLVSYDQTINDLMKERKQQHEQENQVQAKVQVILTENEELRRELLQKCQQMAKLVQSGGGSVVKDFHQLEKEQMGQQMQLLREENDLLQQKYTKARDSLLLCEEQVERSKALEKEGMQRVYDAMKRVQEQNETLEEQAHQLKMAQKQAQLLQRSFADLEAEKREKEEEVFDLNNQVKVKKNQVNNFRLELEEEKDRLGLEIEALYKENEGLKNKQMENSNKYVQNERDLDLVKEDNRRLTKEAEQLKQDNEQLMKMLETQESKILAFTKKEEEMQKMFRENREKTEEAVLQRDKALLREEHYGRTIELVKGQLRQQMAEEGEEHRRQVERLKSRHSQEQEDLSCQCEEQRRLITQLELEAEQLQEEAKSKTREIEHWNAQLTGRAGLLDRSDDQEAKVIQLEENMLVVKKEAAFEVEQAQHHKGILELQCRKQQESILELRSQVSDLEEKLGQEGLEWSRVKNIQGQKEQLQREKETQRLQLLEKMEEMKAAHQSEVMDYKLQNEEIRSRERQGKDKAIQLLKSFDAIEQKMKGEYETRIQDLEQYVAHLKQQNRALVKQ